MRHAKRRNGREPVLLWTLAFLVTLAIAVYQRVTGPTHPIQGTETVGGSMVSYRFLRSHAVHQPLPVTVTIRSEAQPGQRLPTSLSLSFRRFGTGESWTTLPMAGIPDKTDHAAEAFSAAIPGQPAAGKVEYLVSVRDEQGRESALRLGKAVVARFRGNVPVAFLLAHIFFMFLGIWLAVRTGLEALRREGQPARLIGSTLAVAFIGGMILGPIVQKYAFGAFWTGFPLGTDLTDNKMLLAFLFWLAAFLLRHKSRWWTVAAAILMVVVYLIPHSTAGSELDYASGRMKNVYTMNPESQNRKIIFSGRGSEFSRRRAPDPRRWRRPV